ncbi:MAG: TonB-dependent receptor plug domain-containing protein [Bacteroidales bacterium]|jgi:outer membrane receptor for ferrienterochelin and colicin|nr:TonB-dependent receptor plug domain-containing protein [Bacteroidales bacterium]MDD4214626.1 TonB-dependent receptor plug domain-containing protein [Bacteroidales bacterium]
MLLFLISNEVFSQTDSIDIYDLTLTQLSQLKITSASKASQSIREIPSTIYVITAADIKEKGYFTLEEALSDLPGFQFRNTLGMNSYIFQRGVPNQNNLTLILIDGIQVNELNSGGFYGGGQYNLSNVERIEVIYGPGSVAYGTNAVSGIINIVTKSAMTKKSEITALIGNFNTLSTDFTYSTTNKKNTFGILISGMAKKSDKANLKGKAGDNNWSDLMDNFENDYSFDIKMQFHDFTFGTNYMFKQASLATNIKSAGTIYRDYGTLWNIQFVNNYLRYDKKFSDRLSFSSVLYNSNSTVLGNSVYYVVDTAQIGYYRPGNLTGIENVINYSAKKIFSMTGGFIFEFEQVSEKASYSQSDSPDKNPPCPDKPNILNNYLLSIFAEPRLCLFKNLFISGGIRFDQSNVYQQVITPRAGISYNFRKHIVRISYAEAFRAPKPWDYTDGLGNASLLPEKMKSLETAFTFSITDKIKLDIVGYRNYLTNVITKEFPDTTGIINYDSSSFYRWVNDGIVDTYGCELYFRLDYGKIKSSLNYTFNYSKNEEGFFMPEISMHSANASITYSFNEHIKINLRAHYFGKRKNPQLISSTNSYYVGHYFLLDGTLSLLNYKSFTVQVLLKNILNTKYYHTSNREPDRYRQPQFTFMVSLGYTFNR